MDTRHPRRLNPGSVALALVAFVSILSGARTVAAADPLLPSLPVALPSLPVPLPSVPLPTLPIATPNLPTLPPLPTVPLPTLPPPPTPSLPIPTPTLPIVTPTPSPAPSASPNATLATTASPSPGSSGVGGGPIGSDGTLGGPELVPVVASLAPGLDDPGAGTSPSLFDSITVPGLIIGVPLIIVLGILATQVAVGAAWLPIIRKWLGRRV